MVQEASLHQLTAVRTMHDEVGKRDKSTGHKYNRSRELGGAPRHAASSKLLIKHQIQMHTPLVPASENGGPCQPARTLGIG